MTTRRLLSALIAALVSMTAVGAADAQLWKPKKPATKTVKAKKPAPRKAARAKKPARKKGSGSSVVKFGPPKDRGDDEDTREAVADDDVDDNPRISVYDGDRDE